jgi:dihydroxyacetone kinase-like predicted kinase
VRSRGLTGLVVILAGIVAGRRDDLDTAAPGAAATTRTRARHHGHNQTSTAVSALHQLHRHRLALESRSFVPRSRRSRLASAWSATRPTLKVQVHTDEPEDAVALFDGGGRGLSSLDVADMREQIRSSRGAPMRPAGERDAVAVASRATAHEDR